MSNYNNFLRFAEGQGININGMYNIKRLNQKVI